MELDPVWKDALTEFGNIGAAHAATSLSQMLMSPVEMTVPEVMAIDIADLHKYISNDISWWSFRFREDRGRRVYRCQHAPADDHPALQTRCSDDRYRSRDQRDDQSAAIEIGNIMISAFLDATAELLDHHAASPPALAIDMAHAA